MTQTRTYTRSFSGGEVSPELFGRDDLVKFQTGAETLENVMVLAHGPAAGRPGFEFVNRAKGFCRVIPFDYNTEQTYSLEFGENYIRFHTDGATLLSGTSLTITGITQAATGVLTYTGTDPANGTWMFLESIAGMTELNGRYVKVANVNGGANTFELTDLFDAAIDTTDFTAYTSGGTSTAVYEVATTYTEAQLMDLHYVQSADVLTLVHPSHPSRELARVSATSWTLTAITFAPTLAAPAGPAASASPAVSPTITYTYAVTALAADGLEESLQSADATCINTLATAGNLNTVTWSAVSGAVRYNIYRKDDGIYGYVGQSAVTSFVDNNITPDLSVTPPNANTPFGSSDNYPAAVSYAEQRRCFAGTNNRRQTTWMTRAGTESNLTYSIPTRDDDAIIFRVAARENNVIRHLVPLGDLLLLTASGAWRVSAGNDAALTPATVSARPQVYVGANNVQPVVTPASVIYVSAEGSYAQELVYTADANAGVNGYQGNDISIMAPHLFDGYELLDMTYTHARNKIAWFVRDDGVLLGCTYVPKQEVLGWHHHSTDGEFESCCSVVENNRNVLYVSVKRTINGQTVRYIERLHDRYFTALEDAFFVDSGLTYEGTATDTISGLWHLEGETVAALADGAVQPTQVVANGQIVLDHEATKVQVGLPYTQTIKLLPASLQGEAFGHGRPKNVNEVHLRVSRSAAAGLFAGPTLDDLTEVKSRSTEPYGSPPRLRTEELDLVTLPGWADDASMVIRQEDPLPLTLVALTMEIEVGG